MHQICAAARFANVWKAIQGTDSAISSEKADTYAFKAREEKALGLIDRTVAPYLQTELVDARVTPTGSTACSLTAAEQWNYLKDKFEKKDSTSAIIDWGHFLDVQFVDDGTLDKQFNKFQELRSICAINGFNHEDWQIAALILLHLPESYESVKDHFLITDDPKTIKLSDVRARVLERQNRKLDDATRSAANTVSQQPSTSSSNITNNNKGKKRSKRPPNDRPCFNCGKKGHWARECCSKKTASPSSSSNTNPGKPGGSSLNVVEYTTDAESDSPVLCYLGAPENWLMDSGTTDHMTHYGSDFVPASYVKFVESRAVVLGDGTTHLNIISKHWGQRGYYPGSKF